MEGTGRGDEASSSREERKALTAFVVCNSLCWGGERLSCLCVYIYCERMLEHLLFFIPMPD